MVSEHVFISELWSGSNRIYSVYSDLCVDIILILILLLYVLYARSRAVAVPPRACLPANLSPSSSARPGSPGLL